MAQPVAQVPATVAKEFTINKPKSFDGNQKEVNSFLQDCMAYLELNEHIYTTDKSQVMFILSYMDEKEAKRWKENYYLTITNANGRLTFTDLNTLIARIQADFKPANKTRDAEHQIAILRQGKKTAEETITEFRLLSNQAGYANTTESDHKHLIGKLQTVLNTRLVKQIMLSDNAPTTIDAWADKAIQIDSNYRQTMDLIERLVEEKKTTYKPGNFKPEKNNNNSNSNSNNWRKKKERDPDAMDIDAMSPKKRAYLMKKGACFICEEPGHRAKDHDEYEKEQKGKGKAPQKKEVRATQKPEKTSLKEIHALLKNLSPKQKETLVELQKLDPHPEEKEEKEEENSDDEDF